MLASMVCRCQHCSCSRHSLVRYSVTRLGNILDFGQLLKPLAPINLPQSSPFLSNYCKGVKIIFLVKPFLGNFYRHLAIFIWSHCNAMDASNIANVDVLKLPVPKWHSIIVQRPVLPISLVTL